jgi:peptidyl-prolyl cis-trans isomerase C
LLEAVARSRSLHLDRPDQREQALKLVTDMVLIAQSAQRNRFGDDPQFRAEVEAARLKAVAEASVAVFEKRQNVSDDILRAEYDSELNAAGKFEYDFTQLLFADEADALKAEDDLAAGKAFMTVFDTWRTHAKQAKAFSHIRPAQLPDVLTQELATLKDGEHTTIPVKTEFGWHVLQRDAATAYTPPPFDQVKENLRRNVLLKASQQQLEKLREQAKVEYPAGAGAPAADQKRAQ